MHRLKIILSNPEIPQNTGNIIRTCNVTGSSLILENPLGFSMSSGMIKRSGMDYIKNVQIDIIDNLEDFLKNTKNPFYFFSSKAEKKYTDISFSKNSIFIFGSETKGLRKIFKEKWGDRFATIPMKKNARCINLSTSVAIVLYEALRQFNFNFD